MGCGFDAGRSKAYKFASPISTTFAAENTSLKISCKMGGVDCCSANTDWALEDYWAVYTLDVIALSP